MIRRSITAGILSALALALAAVGTCGAKPRVILVVADNISVGDLAESGLPRLSSGPVPVSAGLLNTRTDGNYSSEDGYISIGSGARSRAEDLTGNTALNGDEEFEGRTAAEAYLARTGMRLPKGGVGVLDIARILLDNTDPQFDKLLTNPGGLGNALHAKGLKTGVLGNADAGELLRRHIATTVMDSNGMVDSGDVGPGLLKRDPMSPTGFSTDYRALFERAGVLLRDTDLLAIELGDTSRADLLAETILPGQLERYRKKSVREMDRFMASLAGIINPKEDLLLLVSPTPPKTAKKTGDTLTPVLAMGRGFDGGYVSSPSTRWVGVATNTDMAATVLEGFGIERTEGMVGRPLSDHADGTNLRERLAWLARENSDWVGRNKQRSAVLKVNNTVILIGMLLVSLLLYPKPGFVRNIPEVAGKVGVFTASIPLAFLLHALVPVTPMQLTIPIIAAITAVLGTLFSLLGRSPWRAVCLASLATVGVVLADLWGGLYISRHSLLSYNAVEGARFYGIGNELSGVAIGAAIVGSVLITGTRLPNRRAVPVVATGLFLLFLLASIALPGVGAEFGSTLPCIIGLGMLMLAVLGLRIPRHRVVPGILAAVLLAAGFVLLDLRRGDEVSHVGRLIQGMQAGGFNELLFVIERKLGVNIKLIRKTLWSRVLLALLLPWAVLMLRRGMGALEAKAPVLRPLATASLVTAVGVLLLNDSGVVGACTLMIYPTALLLGLYGSKAE